MNYAWVYVNKHGQIMSRNHQLVGDELARANAEGWSRVNIDIDAATALPEPPGGSLAGDGAIAGEVPDRAADRQRRGRSLAEGPSLDLGSADGES